MSYEGFRLDIELDLRQIRIEMDAASWPKWRFGDLQNSENEFSPEDKNFDFIFQKYENPCFPDRPFRPKPGRSGAPHRPISSTSGHTLTGRMVFWGRYGTEHQCISTQFHRLRGTRKHLNNPRSMTPPAGTCTLVSLLELGAWTAADVASWVLKRCEKKGTQALETQLRVEN